MEFKALCIGVNDRTLDNFGLSCCTGVTEILLEKSMLFQHYAKAIEMGSSF